MNIFSALLYIFWIGLISTLSAQESKDLTELKKAKINPGILKINKIVIERAPLPGDSNSMGFAAIAITAEIENISKEEVHIGFVKKAENEISGSSFDVLWKPEVKGAWTSDRLAGTFAEPHYAAITPSKTQKFKAVIAIFKPGKDPEKIHSYTQEGFRLEVYGRLGSKVDQELLSVTYFKLPENFDAK